MPPPDAPLPLLWMSPLLSGGGYSSEAIAFAHGLLPAWPTFGARQFAEQHADAFYRGLPRDLRRSVEDALERGAGGSAERGVVVCHSTPDAWVPSKFPGWDDLAPCPPKAAAYTIGRTMFETDTLPGDWVERCNRMDEVWIPTAFHRDPSSRWPQWRRRSLRRRSRPWSHLLSRSRLPPHRSLRCTDVQSRSGWWL